MKQPANHPWRFAEPRRAQQRGRTQAPKLKYWEPDEDRLLKAMASTLTAAQIAALLPGRTSLSVENRARRLKVRMTKYGDHHPCTKHSEAKVEHVRSLFDGGMPTKEIAAREGLPLRAVEAYVYYECRLGELTRASANAR